MRQLVEEHHDLFEFNRWLQWIAAEQVNAAQQEALDHGMTLGLMQDMAVGVHGLGAGCLGQSGTLRLRWRHGRLPAGLL